MAKGYLAIVFHAHLPFVRHPEHQDSLEENWFFEAITEVYIPLLLVLEELVEDRVDFRLTFSLRRPSSRCFWTRSCNRATCGESSA